MEGDQSLKHKMVRDSIMEQATYRGILRVTLSWHEGILFHCLLHLCELSSQCLSLDAANKNEAQEQHGLAGPARPVHDGEQPSEDGAQERARPGWHVWGADGPKRLQRLRVPPGSLLPAGAQYKQPPFLWQCRDPFECFDCRSKDS